MSEAADVSLTPAATDQRGFLGHPRGLWYLACTEAWERFSFYGMRALLVLYLVQELLLPGHIENVAGMSAFRGIVEGVLGPLSTQAFASQMFGLYSGLVYFTPLFGGLIADRWLGPKRTVMFGIVLMTLGHFAMAFEVTVLLALTLLVLGSGFLKGNISAQVGHLYPSGAEAERTRGFTIFSTGINIGAIAGPLVCGLLAQWYGWHIGFGIAGVLMVVAAGTYFLGFRHYAVEATRLEKVQSGQRVDRNGRRILLLLGMVLTISLCQFIAYDQLFNVGMIWVSEQVDLVTAAGTLPVPWFTSLDSLAAVLIVPPLIALWRWQKNRGTEPDELGKISIGSAIMSLSVAALAVGAWQAGGGLVKLVYPLIAFTLSGVAFMYTWPTVLAFVSRHAPPSVNALMMAVVYLTAFVTGIGTGYLGIYYEPMGATAFWFMHAGISLAGSVAVIVFGSAIKRSLQRCEVEATQE